MKYKTKNRLFYRELTILQKLNFNYDLHFKHYGVYPKKIYVDKKTMTEYMKIFPSLYSNFYKGKDIITNKGPMYKGIELEII